MSTSYINVVSAHSQVDLGVSTNGLDIIIAPGTVLCHGTSQALAQDTLTVVPDPTYEIHFAVHLVREFSTGNLMWMVDEVVQDGNDTPYVFPADGDPYGIKHFQFLYARVPAAAADLSSTPIVVTRIIPES